MDRSSIEVFVNDGAFVMTDLMFPNEPYASMHVSDPEQEVIIQGVVSIW